MHGAYPLGVIEELYERFRFEFFEAFFAAESMALIITTSKAKRTTTLKAPKPYQRGHGDSFLLFKSYTL